MASSWVPSSPRLNRRVTDAPPSADMSYKNYIWFKGQFERILVGYISQGSEEQLSIRARIAIHKLRDTSDRQPVSCWKVLDHVMKNLVQGRRRN